VQSELLIELADPRQTGEQWVRVGVRTLRVRFVQHRRARRFVLRLCPDGAARVTLPRGGSLGQAQQFVKQNLAWLEKQLLRQATTPPRREIWQAGTEIFFRGQRVRLEVESFGEGAATGFDPSQAGEISGTRRVIRFGTESLRISDAAADLRKAVESHLRTLASRELPMRVYELAAAHQLPVRRVTVRNQHSRWGSCSRRGAISLNWRLVQTPTFVRDYIVLHELAHLKEMNHSKRFWREVALLCPDFAPAERWLKQHSGLLG